MSLFDGEPGELSYGDALRQVAKIAPWNTDPQRESVIAAIEKQHGIGEFHPLTLAERASALPVDPMAAELASLRAIVAQLTGQAPAAPVVNAAPAQDPKDAELARLQALLAPPPVPVVDPRDAQIAQLQAVLAARSTNFGAQAVPAAVPVAAPVDPRDEEIRQLQTYLAEQERQRQEALRAQNTFTLPPIAAPVDPRDAQLAALRAQVAAAQANNTLDPAHN